MLIHVTSVLFVVFYFGSHCRCEYFDDLVPSNPNKCPLPRIRKAWHEHTDQEKSDFVRTVDAMKQYKGVSPNLYDYFGCTHNVRNVYWHGGSFFLPIHRFLLWKFETALQFIARTVGPTLNPPVTNPCPTVPYWGWELDASVDGNSPNKSVLFDGGYLGPRPDPKAVTYEVTSGAFSKWKTQTLLNTKCGDGLCGDPILSPQYGPATYNLKRYFSSKIAFTSNPVILMHDIASQSEYEAYSISVEGFPHVNPHLWVGYDMARQTSPFDPLFWMHHSNIDRIFAIWQDCYDYEGVLPGDITEKMYKARSPRKEPTTPAGLDDPIPLNHPTYAGPFDGITATVRQIWSMGNANSKGLENMYFRYSNDFIVNNYADVGGSTCPSNAKGWNLVNYKSTSSKRQLSNDQIFNRMLEHTNTTLNIQKIKTMYDTYLQKAKQFNKKGIEGLAFVAKLICDHMPKFEITPDFLAFIEMNGVPLTAFDSLCGNYSSWCHLPGNGDRDACTMAQIIIVGETQQESTQQKSSSTTELGEGMMVVPKWVFGTVVGLGVLMVVVVAVVTALTCSMSKKKISLPSNLDVL